MDIDGQLRAGIAFMGGDRILSDAVFVQIIEEIGDGRRLIRPRWLWLWPRGG